MSDQSDTTGDLELTTDCITVVVKADKLPSIIMKRLNITVDDYVLVKAKKVKWYHMINWTAVPHAYEMLSEDLKRAIKEDEVD